MTSALDARIRELISEINLMTGGLAGDELEELVEQRAATIRQELSMTPTIGRIVHYTLSSGDVGVIEGQRRQSALSGNPVREGDVYPAVIVRIWSRENGCANIRVLLDGRDDYWATSRCEGDEPGQWAWPTRD